MSNFNEHPLTAVRNIGGNHLYYQEDSIFTDKLLHNYSNIDDLIYGLYQDNLNDEIFRSEYFTQSHNGLHILFNGCSVTSGVGLLYEEIWAKLLYNRILQDNECSGFYNIAVGGTSHFTQVANFFKYFKKYGNPDIIFYQVTSLNRFYNFSNEDNTKFVDSLYDEQSQNILNIVAFQYYYMLEQYCKANGIRLISFTWHEPTQNFFAGKFDTFFTVDKQKVLNFVFDYEKNNPGDSYAVNARDGKHLGTGYHIYWSDMLYDLYKGIQ